jgi:tetratricopeptide (TPR) repeat protein
MKRVTALLLILASLIVSVNVVHKTGFAIGSVKTDEVASSMYGDFLAAKFAQSTGKAEYAVEFIESAIAKEPENKELLKRSYGLFVYNGEFEKAIDQANRQIEMDKQAIAKKQKFEFNPNAYLIASVKAFKDKKYSTATEILKPILASGAEPTSHIDGVILPMIAAWSNVADKKFPEAFKVIDGITSSYMLSVFSYHRAIINDIANNKPVVVEGKKYEPEALARELISELFTEVGKYSFTEKNLEEAVIYFRFADFLDGGDEVKTLLASAFEAQEKFENAIAVLQTVPKSSKIYNDAQIAIAIDYFKIKNIAEAEKTLNEVAAEDGYNYKASLVLAGLKMEQKNFEESVKIINAALENIEKITPDQAPAYFNLGICHDKLGKWDDAEKNLQKALELQPQNPEFLNYLAYSWIIRGKNIDQSKKMLEQAVINSGGAGHILDSYGWALYKLGEYKKALSFLEQASAQMPYNPVINEHLGDTYWKLDRKKEAQFQWKRALENYKPEFEEIDLPELKRKADQGMN